MTWLLDCDGVVWLGGSVIAGVPEAVGRLREAGERVAFLTNNSWPRREEHVAKLNSMGIPATADDVVTSAMAAASVVTAGERALLVGGPGLKEELESAGTMVFEPGEDDPATADVVVVGMDLNFSYARLQAATTALRAGGARLVASNEDATFPTTAGLLPGAGSILAAVSTAGGRQPLVAGKPHPPVVELVRKLYDDVSLMVGDRPSTDGLFAEALGVPFGLVLSGVTKPGHGAVSPAPSYEAADLASLVDELTGRPEAGTSEAP